MARAIMPDALRDLAICARFARMSGAPFLASPTLADAIAPASLLGLLLLLRLARR